MLPAFGFPRPECLHVPDDEIEVRTALDADGDVLVVTGSSAHGPADYLRPALDAAGAKLLVDGVACRPGHPMLLARLPDNRYVVGLPGNPLAALAGTVTLLLPLLHALAGRSADELRALPSTHDLPGRAGDTNLVPVRTIGNGITPTGHAGSAMLRGAAFADAFALVPPDGVSAGSPVSVVRFIPPSFPGNTAF